MRLKTDALTDQTRKPVPTLAQKDLERAQLAKDCEAFLQAGGEVRQIPTSLSSARDTDGNFLPPGYTNSREANARGGRA